MESARVDQDADQLLLKLAHTEKALERAESLALAGRFSATIMHEINGPLEAVTNFAYLLRTGELSHEARTYLDLMDEQLCRLREIAHQTLVFYRAEQRLQRADLAGLVGVALRVYQKQIAEKAIKVELRAPAGIFFDVFPAEFTQAISNLVANAIDASQSGGCIVICLKDRPPKLHIIISDTGSGVPLHVRATLFDAFTSGKKAGHGLGLWICRRAVEKHGGRICFRSSTKPGRSGTTFKITLHGKGPSTAAVAVS